MEIFMIIFLGVWCVLLTVAFGLLWGEIRGMQNSTHSVQFVPAKEAATSFDELDDETRKLLEDDLEPFDDNIN